MWREFAGDDSRYRLTQYARGGGCACKIPPGELEEARRRARPRPRVGHGDLLVGLDDGDDAAVVRVDGGAARSSAPPTSSPRSSTTPYDWGRIARGERALRRVRDGRRAGASR